MLRLNTLLRVNVCQAYSDVDSQVSGSKAWSVIPNRILAPKCKQNPKFCEMLEFFSFSPNFQESLFLLDKRRGAQEEDLYGNSCFIISFYVIVRGLEMGTILQYVLKHIDVT